MEKNEFDFVENIENIPDKSVIITIKGLTRRINYLMSLQDETPEQRKVNVISNLETRLGVFEEEAEKRGIPVENA